MNNCFASCGHPVPAVGSLGSDVRKEQESNPCPACARHRAEAVRTLAGWSALKAACRSQHPRGPGGAAMCACGAGGGGSAACSMLAELKQLVRSLDPATLPENMRAWVERLQGAIH